MFRGVKTPIPTYLSIDIDFFGYPFLASLEEFELFLEGVAKFSSDNNILIQAMVNHPRLKVVGLLQAPKARTIGRLTAPLKKLYSYWH